MVFFDLPPGPMHSNVYKSFPEKRVTLLSVPLVGRLPCHSPLAKHSVASVDDHLMTTVSPRTRSVGFTEILTTGFGPCAEPPPSPHPKMHVTQDKIQARAALLHFVETSDILRFPLTILSELQQSYSYSVPIDGLIFVTV